MALGGSADNVKISFLEEIKRCQNLVTQYSLFKKAASLQYNFMKVPNVLTLYFQQPPYNFEGQSSAGKIRIIQDVFAQNQRKFINCFGRKHLLFNVRNGSLFPQSFLLRKENLFKY